MSDSQKIALQLRAAIANNQSAKDMFYNFVSSGTKEANYLGNQLLNNKEVLRIITSPQGRGWIKRNLDDFLNYLQQLGV